MSTYVTRSELRIDAALCDFVEREALPGTGLDGASFWQGTASLFARFAPENRALLARQMTAKSRKLPFITTLHGTDITLVGAEPSYFPITKFSIEQSDGVTCISNYLKKKTIEEFDFTGRFQMDYFNVLNRVQFNGPGTNIDNANYGLLSAGQQNTPRQGQLSGRFVF